MGIPFNGSCILFMIAWKIKIRTNSWKDHKLSNLHFSVDHYVWIMGTLFLPIVAMAIYTVTSSFSNLLFTFYL